MDLEKLRRDSQIHLDRSGQFFYRGRRVENDRVQALFHAGLQCTPAGELTLHVGGQWCYVTADGPFWFVRRVSLAPQGLLGELVGGQRVPLDPGSFGVDPQGVFTCARLDASGRAVLQRQAALDLEPLLEESPDGAALLRVNGESFPMMAEPRAPMEEQQ